jgi:integrase
MTRGRKRKPDPSIPRHIDQAKIPAGIYWDKSGAGRWRVIDVAENGKPKFITVAGADALLSDLHRIIEVRQGGADRETVRGLANAFKTSSKFRELAKATQTDYTYCRAVVVDYKTKQGGTFGDLKTRQLTRPLIQRLVDVIGEGAQRDVAGDLVPTPTKAAHVQRYLRRLFEWGINRGFLDINPAEGIELPTERKRRRLPDSVAMVALVAFAQANAGGRGTLDSVAPYLWAVIDVAYLCRLRGIEVLDLTDACLLDDGLSCVRRKGSRQNTTAWSPRLRAACDALLAYRKARWEKKKTVLPIDAAKRPLVIAWDGTALSKSALNSAWQRLIHLAIDKGVLTAEQRFGLHDLKRRGITDTEGTNPEKQLASGHRSESMLTIYDQSVPLVQPAGVASLRKIPQEPQQ